MFFTSAILGLVVQVILEAVNFVHTVKCFDPVITGEGYTDCQTIHGKAPV
jgi:glycerate kinase